MAKDSKTIKVRMIRDVSFAQVIPGGHKRLLANREYELPNTYSFRHLVTKGKAEYVEE